MRAKALDGYAAALGANWMCDEYERYKVKEFQDQSFPVLSTTDDWWSKAPGNDGYIHGNLTWHGSEKWWGRPS